MAEARELRRRFVTRVDVEDAARAGSGITLGPTDVMTDEARSRARDLRVAVTVAGAAGAGAGGGVGGGLGVAPSGWVGNQLGQLGRGGASARGGVRAGGAGSGGSGSGGSGSGGSGSGGSGSGGSGSGGSGSGPSLRDRVQAAVMAELGHADDRVVQTIEAVLARRGLR